MLEDRNTASEGIEENVATAVDARHRVEMFADRVRTIRGSLHEVVVGQDDVIDQLLICSLTGSHALLVGVPGLAKTLMVKALGLRRSTGSSHGSSSRPT